MVYRRAVTTCSQFDWIRAAMPLLTLRDCLIRTQLAVHQWLVALCGYRPETAAVLVGGVPEIVIREGGNVVGWRRDKVGEGTHPHGVCCGPLVSLPCVVVLFGAVLTHLGEICLQRQ